MSKRNTRKAPENILNVEEVVIPSTILFDPELTARERLLFGILDRLAKESPDGYVYATNIELGKVLGLDPQIASNGIANLRRRGFIEVEYGIAGPDESIVYERYDGNEQWSRTRRIRPVPQD